MNLKNKFVFLFFVFFVLGLSAKNSGFVLNLGGAYTNHRLNYIDTDNNSENFKHHMVKYKHLGGFNIGASYAFPKNWSVYIQSIFSFNNVFVNDTQLGLGYTFQLKNGFKLFLGGAFAIGGSIFKYSYNGITVENRAFNIGGGIDLTASYMFMEKFGVFIGFSDALYKSINGKEIVYANGEKKFRDIEEKYMPDLTNSVNLKLGFKIGL